MAVSLIEGRFGSADGLGEREFRGGWIGGDDGQASSEGAIVEPGAEDCGSHALSGCTVLVGLGDTLDEAMHAQAPQIVGDASGGVLARLVAEERSKMLAEVFVSEGAADVEEQEQDVEQGLNAEVGEAQGRGPLAIQRDRFLHFLERRLTDEAVMTDALDVEQTSIGCEAYGAELIEIFDASTDFEVASVINGGFGSECLAFLVVLLDPVLFVVDVQRRDNTMGNHPGAESAGRVAHDSAVEHEAHLAWPANVKVLPDDLLEEDAPGNRPIENLGERELCLQNRDVVAIACGAVARREWMRQAAKPLAQELIDLGGRQAIAEPLRQLGVGTGLDAVVERFERHAALGQLALEVFVTVDGELGVVGEVGTELQKEWAEVFVDGVEVVVIDHGRAVHDVRIGLSSLGAVTPLRPLDPGLLLGLSDVEHTFGALELSQVLLSDCLLYTSDAADDL